MSYEKIGFEKGQVLKAEHLNHIEDGVADVATKVAEVSAKAVVGYESMGQKTLTWDGDTTGRTQLWGCYKVFDEVIDLSTVTKAIFSYPDVPGSPGEEVVTEFTPVTVDDGVYGLKAVHDGYAYDAMVVVTSDGSNVKKGTYLGGGMGWVSALDCTGTITHTIEPKFLPIGGIVSTGKANALADFVMPAGKGGSSSAYIKAPFLFTDGDSYNKTYFITVNGKTFELTGKKGTDTFEIGNYNLEIEPHLYIEEYPDATLWNIYVNDPNGQGDTIDRHIVIETKEPNIHITKTPAFGSVCLPVIEVASQEATLTGAEALQIDAAVQAKMPIILKVKTNTWGWVSVFMHYIDGFNGKGSFFHTFSGPIFSGGATIEPEYTVDGCTGNWVVSFSVRE